MNSRIKMVESDYFAAKSVHLDFIRFWIDSRKENNRFVIFNDFTVAIVQDDCVRDPSILARIESHIKLSLQASERVSGLKIDFVYFDPETYNEFYAQNLQSEESKSLIGDIEDDSNDIKQKLISLIAAGVKMRASDIHIIASEHGQTIINYRVNSRISSSRPVVHTFKEIVAVLARAFNWEGSRNSDNGFNLAEEGKTTFSIDVPVTVGGTLKTESVRVRIQKGPIHNGINAVMRLTLDKEHKDLFELGVNPQLAERLIDRVRKPHGMIVITGPTGSGKTTLLHGLLHHISDDLMVQGVEDPVEVIASYNNKIAQANLDPSLGYVGHIKSFMRKDPDIILIGELRDKEVASHAVDAALTGHLVFTTFHTNNSLGTILRLADMGVSYFTMSMDNILSTLIATRIAPILCPHCKKPIREHPDFIKHQSSSVLIHKHADTIYVADPKGCSHCHDGVCGVKPIIEYTVIDSNVRQFIGAQDMKGLENYLLHNGWKSLDQIAETMVIAGDLDPFMAEEQFDNIFGDDKFEYNYNDSYGY